MQLNRRGQGKWPRQTTNLVRGRGKSTSYHYIKLTWKKFVFHNGIYSDLEYLRRAMKEMFDAMEHAKMLKIFRKKAKMTQEDIAEELNVTQSCVSKYESGRKPLDLSAFLKWCRITNCEVEAAAILFGPELCAQAMHLLQTVPMFIGGMFTWVL